MPITREKAEARVNRALEALDSILTIARGTISFYKQQQTLLKKSVKEFEASLDDIFQSDDIVPESDKPD